ncbi:exodeoxyribonuclease VII small subunit [Candidatus Endowatersipora endosymbiont of Watersipora subatra]|uniref:exodeoxyribonuclease VII small subunit n=1 Tax=Candidatus Endowatersipora endosymbiont of Watersipora subatra TaxID=3077946 RepID=UPI00312CAF6E
MSKISKITNISTLSFEEALEQLEKIVNNLEGGDVSLDESITFYEQGELLKKHCAKLLQAAEDKVEKIRLGVDGSIKGTEPLIKS